MTTDQTISFLSIASEPIWVRLLELKLVPTESKSMHCRMTFEIPFENYSTIETHSLFNLQHEFCGGYTNGNFLPEYPIQISIALHPTHIHELLRQGNTLDSAINYLQMLSQQQYCQKELDANSISPLLISKNWLALAVKQIRDDDETGYSTFWNYIDLTHLQNAEDNTEQLAEDIAQFFQDWTEHHLTHATQELTDGFFSEITTVFDELAEAFKDAPIDDAPADIDSSETDTPTQQRAAPLPSIHALLQTFFNDDDWPYVAISDDTAFQLAFEGQHGRWHCYAKAREAQSQIVFYSIAPISVPDPQRLIMAEFITRANSGLVIGNFELDFDDGEIRYKTSLDIEGLEAIDLYERDSANALIQQIVYANVTTMDVYLPGILALVNNQLSAVDAIAQVKNTDPLGVCL